MDYRDGTKFGATILDNREIHILIKVLLLTLMVYFYIRITNFNGVANLNINLQPGNI